jgi:tetratricopeptide (TPR) repeat protein
MSTKKSKGPAQYTRSRKLLYNFILVCFPAIILIFFELFLRIIHYGDNFNLFLDFPENNLSEKYRYINPVIGKKYFQKLQYTTPCGDMFLKEKPKNGFRVLVMGSSTVLGFPYNQNVMFTRILQERLQDSYPDKKVEVINTALTAVNSFTLLDFIGDVLDEDPDVVLIYAGHNEFYGAFGIGSVEKSNRWRALILVHEKLLTFRLYQFLRNAITRTGEVFSGDNTDQDVRGTLMKLIVDNKEIGYKSETYSIGIERYRKNIEQIVKKAKRKNVPVFISELVSNTKDIKPFCSETSAGYPAALDIYNNGITNEMEGEFNPAKENYYRAKDLDCIRFRASEDINKVIHELAAKYNAHLIPMKNVFEDASPNKLIGYNLITEHLHPNIDGYFLMADAFYNAITGSNIMGGPVNPVYYKNSSYYRKNWGFTELDSLFAVHQVNIITCYWPFQSIEATADLYKKTYRPKSLADSLAFTVATSNSIKIDEAHLRLADVYKKRGDYYNAFKEYYANIKYDPFQVTNYNEAVNCLIHTNDFPLALKLLDKSLELKPTFYAYGIRSEILFLKEDYKEAEKALNSASELDRSRDAKVQILANLYKIQYCSRNFDRAQETLRGLREITPGYQPVIPRTRKYAYYIPVQVEGMVNNALEHCKTQSFDAALDGFLKSLEIKETALANRCVGDILYTRNESSALLYYQKAYPDYKNDVDFLHNLGIMYLKNRMTNKAQAILDEIRKLDPDYVNISFLVEKIRAQQAKPN